MGAASDRPTVGRPSERRTRRSARLVDALRLQLDACREEEGLAAIVVSDELGFCVAHSGGDGIHEELAARLPLLADPALRRSHQDLDEGAVSSPTPSSLVVTTFSVAGETLHACAVAAPGEGTGGSGHDRVLTRVADGFIRLLSR